MMYFFSCSVLNFLPASSSYREGISLYESVYMMHVWMRTSEKSPTTFHSLIHPLAFIAMVMVVLHLSQGFTKKEFHACCTDIIATQSLALCALCFPIPSFKFSIFVFSQFSSLPLYYFFNFFVSCKACRAHRNVIFMKLFSFSSS